MKLLIRIGIFVFGILAACAFSQSLSLVYDLIVHNDEKVSDTPGYHFALYLPDNRTSFFTAIIAGAEKAAKEVGAVISIHSIDPGRNELEMASYTGVDGVIVCPYLDDRTARRQLEKLTAKKIPLITINHYVATDQPWPFIGANNFDVGRKMGSIARRVASDRPRLAIVYSDKSPGIFAERDLVELGIAAAFADQGLSPITVLKTNLNPLDAEEMIYRLFRTTPQINALIFTDSNDTIAAAQVLIDLNLVGRVQIIGFGNDPSILEFIRKGIIAGTIVLNPEKIGFEAVRSLAGLIATGYTSTAVDTGVQIIDINGL